MLMCSCEIKSLGMISYLESTETTDQLIHMYWRQQVHLLCVRNLELLNLGFTV
jgi:hypothetical protein